jgi:hypothetical protein
VEMTDILYNVTIAFIKISILPQYLRIFAPPRHTNRAVFYGIHKMMVVNILFYTILSALAIFACTPRELIWNKLVKGRRYNFKRSFSKVVDVQSHLRRIDPGATTLFDLASKVISYLEARLVSHIWIRYLVRKFNPVSLCLHSS